MCEGVGPIIYIFCWKKIVELSESSRKNTIYALRRDDQTSNTSLCHYFIQVSQPLRLFLDDVDLYIIFF